MIKTTTIAHCIQVSNKLAESQAQLKTNPKKADPALLGVALIQPQSPWDQCKMKVTTATAQAGG